MMKRVHTSAGIAILMSAALLACSSPEQRVAKFTKEGQTFLEEGDFLKANLQFRNALKIDESHVPALKGLVEISEEKREFELMFGLLQRLNRLEPENVDALVKLGNLYLLSSDEAQAQETVDQALRIEPTNNEAKALKAAILFKLGDKATAVGLAEQVLNNSPADQNAMTILVADKASRNDFEGALADIEKGLAKDPDHVLLQFMRIELLKQLGRDSEIDSVFKELIATHSEDPAYSQRYAQYLVGLERYEEARPLLMDVVRLTPESIDNKMNVIRLDYHTKGPDSALETFEVFIAERPDDAELNFAYADFLELRKDVQGAEAVFKSYLGKRTDEALRNRAKVELAALYVSNDRRPEAEKLLAEVLKVDEGNTDALVQLAGLKIQDEKLDEAIIDLREASNNNPDNVTALLMLSAAFEKKGDIEFAELQLTRAFEKSNAGITATNAFAKFLIRNEKLGRAEEVLEQSLALYEDNVEGLRLLAAARLALQKWQGAQEAARLIEAQTDNPDPAVKRILGTASVGLGDYTDAISQLSAANAEQPLSSQPLATLVSAYIAENRTDEAKELLTRMMQNDPENYDVRILLSRVSFAQNRRDDGESFLNEAIRVAPERIEAYDLLFRYYLRTDRRPEAFALIYEGLEKYPENYGLKVFEADILITERRYEEAIIVYETLLRRRPNDRLVANNYASLLSDNKSDEASLKRAVEVAETIRSVENPYFQDTLGWAYFKAGDLQNARLILRRAVEDYPNVPVLHYHLGAVYLALEDVDDARALLEKSLELGGERFRHADKVRALLKQA